MSEPRTAADVIVGVPESASWVEDSFPDEAEYIRGEARAQLLAELRERVAALPRYQFAINAGVGVQWERLAAILDEAKGAGE